MNSTFKKETASSVGTSEVTLYTVPADTTTVIIGFLLANKLSSLVTVDITLGGVSFGKDIPVPTGSTLSALDGKVVMETGDEMKVTASEASAIDVYLSIMEMT